MSVNLSPDLATARAKRINVRDKGRRGEQEVATMLREAVSAAYEALGREHEIEIKRNQMQTAGKHRDVGQGDIVGLEWLSIEVKRVENNLPSGIANWWEQCKRQADPLQDPVLFHRMNSQEWSVRTYVLTLVGATQIKLPVDMPWRIFRIWLIEQIKHRAG